MTDFKIGHELMRPNALITTQDTSQLYLPRFLDTDVIDNLQPKNGHTLSVQIFEHINTSREMDSAVFQL
jgi:hypothetical protein